MEIVPQTPEKPGWYWDPWELEHNLALRERWRQEVILTESGAYRLRRWDGLTWSDDTLREYTMQGLTLIPYRVGPTTLIHPLTPAQNARNYTIWTVLMVLGALAWLVFAVLG